MSAYTKYFSAKSPYLAFDKDIKSGVAYLLKHNDTKDERMVYFSKTHAISIIMLLKIISIYGIKKIVIYKHESHVYNVSDLTKIPNFSTRMEELKTDINAYVPADTRRIILLLKLTKNKNYLKALKRQKFIVLTKVNKYRLEPFVTYQTYHINDKEIKNPFLLIFSDSYSVEQFYNTYKSNELINQYSEFYNDDVQLDENYQPILMTYEEIKHYAKNSKLAGIYLNTFDVSIFNKNLNYIMLTRNM